MGEALTRVYRNGVLEAEGFPVADVSDYLEQPDTAVWVDFCAPPLSSCTNSPGSSAYTNSRSRTPSVVINALNSIATRHTSSSLVKLCALTQRKGVSTRRRWMRS